MTAAPCYARAMTPTLATCDDCGAVWRRGDELVGLEVFTFPEPPHRLLVWRCDCGAELGAWTDRDGTPIKNSTGASPDGK